MSDTSQGHGWWLASDGKWYPPELWTGPPEARPGGAPSGSAPRSYGAPGGYGAPGSAEPGPTDASPTPGSYPSGGYTGYAYGQQMQYPSLGKRTNGLAIAALVCGIGGFLFFIPAVLGVVFGFVARSQIRESNGTQGGEGPALAGIIAGFAWIALLIFVIVVSATTNNTTDNGAVFLHLAAAI